MYLLKYLLINTWNNICISIINSQKLNNFNNFILVCKCNIGIIILLGTNVKYIILPIVIFLFVTKYRIESSKANKNLIRRLKNQGKEPGIEKHEFTGIKYVMTG